MLGVMGTSRSSLRHTQAWFATTQWSVVLSAQQADSVTSAQALEGLCQTYWYPLYAFVRHQGYQPDEAADMTQGFFARLLEKDWLADVDQNRGRFRNFLMASIKHFVSNERAKQRAKRRGGDKHIVSMDIETAESRLRLEPVDTTTPERLFERQWALTLLEEVLGTLQREYEQREKTEVFRVLKGCLMGSRDQQPYDQLAEQLDSTAGHVRVLVHRLRVRYRQLLREAVAGTVATPDEVDAEMEHLKRVLTHDVPVTPSPNSFLG
ncbi:RNA polymerase sigma factor [Planctomycetota bacterium]